MNVDQFSGSDAERTVFLGKDATIEGGSKLNSPFHLI